LRGAFSAMVVKGMINRFYRRFVTEILRESTSVAPKGASAASFQLKDLDVGRKDGKLVTPEASLSTDSACPITHHQVTTPGGGTRYVVAPASGGGYRRYRYI
jgi:hypothetical protein